MVPPCKFDNISFISFWVNLCLWSILTLGQFLTNICNIDFTKFEQFLIDHRPWWPQQGTIG